MVELKIVDLDTGVQSKKDTILAVLAGREPFGYLTDADADGYWVVVRDDMQELNLNGALVQIQYNVLDLDGDLDEIHVLCIVRGLESGRDLSDDFDLRGGRIPGFGLMSQFVRAHLSPICYYSVKEKQLVSARGTARANGPVFLLNKENLVRFSATAESHLRLGWLLGTRIECGLVVKHFGKGERGWGDALMLGIFGPTGSGKTMFAAQVCAGYAAYPEMGLLLLDPQGQLSQKDAQGNYEGNLAREGTQPWRLSECLRRANRQPLLVQVSELSFERPHLFVNFLAKQGYFRHFYPSSGEKKRYILEAFMQYLKSYMKKRKLSSIGDLKWCSELYEMTIEIIASCYSDMDDMRETIRQRIVQYELVNWQITHGAQAQKLWQQTLSRFSGGIRLSELVDKVLFEGQLVILSLQGVGQDETDSDDGGIERFADEKLLYCAEIFDTLRQRAQQEYYKGRKANALVFMDEAQALFSSAGQASELEERIEETLIQSVRTTRKLGLGWFFSSTSLHGLPRSIYEQLNTKIFGQGLLQRDSDADLIKDAFGGNSYALNQYRTLPRPRNTNTFVFAVTGEMSPIGSGVLPLFIQAFGQQEQFLQANPSFFRC